MAARVDVLKLFRVWNTPGLTINQVASQMGLSLGQLRRLRDKYGLLEHTAEKPSEQMPGDPSPEEIAERAAEVRASWPAWRLNGGSRLSAPRYHYDGRQHVFRRMPD